MASSLFFRILTNKDNLTSSFKYKYRVITMLEPGRRSVEVSSLILFDILKKFPIKVLFYFIIRFI